MTDRSRGINEHLRVLLRAPDPGSDTDLLARFVAERDGEAFAALVRRHGAMVLGVCRRVLRGHADAEDAFQATFLVLARRAGAIRSAAGLANWLHGVAYRTALEARRAMAVRRVKEQRAADLRDYTTLPSDTPPDLREVLDRELAALPDAYRSAVILCDLEGLARREAAHLLGWSEGTLSGRLFRARALLARRLKKHGLAVAAGVVGAVAARSAVAGVPVGLAESTVRIGILMAAGGVAGAAPAPVAALTEGVMKAMLLTKLKGMTAALVVGCAVLVTAAAGWQANAAGQPDRPGGERAGPPGTRSPKSDKERIAELERERELLLKLVADLKVRVDELEAERRNRLDAPEARQRALLAYIRQLDQARANRPVPTPPAVPPDAGPAPPAVPAPPGPGGPTNLVRPFPTPPRLPAPVRMPWRPRPGHRPTRGRKARGDHSRQTTHPGRTDRRWQYQPRDRPARPYRDRSGQWILSNRPRHPSLTRVRCRRKPCPELRCRTGRFPRSGPDPVRWAPVARVRGVTPGRRYRAGHPVTPHR